MNILEVRRGHNAGSIKKDFQDHLDFTLVCNRDEARLIDYYQTLAYTIRDRLIDRGFRFDYPTIDSLAAFVLRSLFAEEEVKVQGEPEETAEDMGQVLDVSDDDAEAMLLEELARIRELSES